MLIAQTASAWALRDTAGEPTWLATFVLAAALTAVAAFIVALRGKKRLALWLAILMLGQIIALRLVDAGNLIGYQHVKSAGAMLRDVPPIWLALLALQALAALWAGWRLFIDAVRWVGRTVRWWQLLLILTAVVLSSAALSRTVHGYVEELVIASLLQLLALGTVLVTAASPSTRPRVVEWLMREDDTSPSGARLSRVAVFAALWVVVVASLLNVLSYQRHPHVPDEVSYLIHARYFAEGVLTLPAPPVPAAFDIYLMELLGDRWYSVVPPGWPFALSLGMLVGAPWIVNPLLGGLSVLLTWSLVRGLFSERVARITVLLLASSPWFLFMNMSFMTHALSLLFALLAAWSVMKMRSDGRIRWAILGGIGLGVVGLTRPLEGLAIALPLGVWALGPSWRRPRLLHAAALALSTVAAVAATLPYNAYFTGHLSQFPLMAYAAKEFPLGSNALGFGPDRGLGWPGLDPFPGHGPLDVLVNAVLNSTGSPTEQLGWAVGSMLLPAIAIVWMRKRHADWLMIAVVAIIVGIHSLYWFSGGPDFGARYWYLILIPLLVLCARALEELGTSIDERSPGQGWRVYLAALVLVISALATFVPWRAMDKYYHYRRMRPDVRELAERNSFGRSLVLVRGSRHPDYASAGYYNPSNPFADAPVFAWDRAPDVRRAVVDAYRDRPIWILEGPTITGRGYRIVEGPLRADDLLRRSGDPASSTRSDSASVSGAR